MDMQQAAQKALDIQDACNLSGVAHTFDRVVSLVCEQNNHRAKCYEAIRHGDITDAERGRFETRFGTAWKNNHPVLRLFICKMHDLSGLGLSDTKVFGEAYDLCVRIAAGDIDAY